MLLSVVDVVGDEQEGVDHLMQQGLHQVTARPQGEQGPAQADRAQTGGGLVGADPGTADGRGGSDQRRRQTSIVRP